MILSLITIRHPAYANSNSPAIAPLTYEGELRAAQTARKLRKEFKRGTPLVLHSGATRTRQLAVYIAVAFGVNPQPADWLTFGPTDLGIVSWAQDYRSAGLVIACAHKPCIQELLHRSGRTETIDIPFGGTFRFDLDFGSETITYVIPG